MNRREIINEIISLSAGSYTYDSLKDSDHSTLVSILVGLVRVMLQKKVSNATGITDVIEVAAAPVFDVAEDIFDTLF